mmetsp:Transcript_13002/g.36579  ORF Transcript_13002/g.36579 Transcript_13002/m.36579 type:complete len:203 (+) Transcript_13002:641-1249(+)
MTAALPLVSAIYLPRCALATLAAGWGEGVHPNSWWWLCLGSGSTTLDRQVRACWADHMKTKTYCPWRLAPVRDPRRGFPGAQKSQQFGSSGNAGAQQTTTVVDQAACLWGWPAAASSSASSAAYLKLDYLLARSAADQKGRPAQHERLLSFSQLSLHLGLVQPHPPSAAQAGSLWEPETPLLELREKPYYCHMIAATGGCRH